MPALLPKTLNEEESEQDILSLLPDEVLLHMFSFVDDVKSLCMVGSVCKQYVP